MEMKNHALSFPHPLRIFSLKRNIKYAMLWENWQSYTYVVHLIFNILKTFFASLTDSHKAVIKQANRKQQQAKQQKQEKLGSGEN